MFPRGRCALVTLRAGEDVDVLVAIVAMIGDTGTGCVTENGRCGPGAVMGPIQ